MERTWKPKAAGILCIIVGAIWMVSGVVLSAISGDPSFGTFLIPGIIPIVGGIYALRRRKWGLALTGSILTLLSSVLLGIYGIIIVIGSIDNPSVNQINIISLLIFLIADVAISGILGILAIIFVSLGKREFE
jgi:drug/metabolite transporter (DMT)-like permease